MKDLIIEAKYTTLQEKKPDYEALFGWMQGLCKCFQSAIDPLNTNVDVTLSIIQLQLQRH